MSTATEGLNIGPLTQVDRRAGLSVGEFRKKYLYPGRPVVITNAIGDWKALSLWTLDYFRSRYGRTLVTLSKYEGAHYQPRDVETLSLESFIDAIKANDFTTYPYYIRDDWRIFRTHKELL